jgi:serine/threonine-protein kinase RsbT
MPDEVRVPIREDADLIVARAEGRALASGQGFSRTDATLIATAISEIARNIVVHAGRGEIVLRAVDDGWRLGVQVVARDEGPGIRDVEALARRGFTAGHGLGLGLPGARRLVDDFEVVSASGEGTTVTMTKWRVPDELADLRERRDRLGRPR